MVLEQKVRETITRYEMFSPGDRVLVGVSGGPDSTALLAALVHLKCLFRYQIAIAHLEHGIRGASAQEDARFVRTLGIKLSLPVHSRTVDLPGMKAGLGAGNLEAMARAERYHFFASVAAEHGFSKIAVGHTQDDQAETLLMWLLRGCGRGGLAGMRPVRRLGPSGAQAGQDPLLVRPLIDVPRSDVLDYLAAQGLSYRRDDSNEDPAYLRNWLRVDLLPRLQARTDSKLASRLGRLAALLQADEAFFQREVERAYARVAVRGTLQRGPFLLEDVGLRSRLIRYWLERNLGNLRRINHDHVEAILRMIAGTRPQGQLSLPGAWLASREYEAIRLRRSPREVESPGYYYPLTLPGDTVVPEAGVRLQASCHVGPVAARPQDAAEAFFDPAALRRPLGVRNRRPGDRLTPIGMEGRRKLKDILMEKRVPRASRGRLPLLVMGEEILWVPTCARSDLAKIGKETQKILRIRVFSINHQDIDSY